MRMYRPQEVAEKLGVCTKTVERWRISGKIKVIKLPGGRHRIPESEVNKILGIETKEEKEIIGYARVSTKNQIRDLEVQIEYIKKHARDKYGKDIEVYSDIASGLNEKRAGLKKVLKRVENGEIEKVLLSNRERLTRFGFSYLERYFKHFGTEIEVIDSPNKPKSPQEELVRDLISLVASFAGRLYGFRSHKKKEVVNGTKKLLSCEN
ncbi:MAG: IS607 family transposase [Methanosarcinales archaeon]